MPSLASAMAGPWSSRKRPQSKSISTAEDDRPDITCTTTTAAKMVSTNLLAAPHTRMPWPALAGSRYGDAPLGPRDILTRAARYPAKRSEFPLASLRTIASEFELTSRRVASSGTRGRGMRNARELIRPDSLTSQKSWFHLHGPHPSQQGPRQVQDQRLR